MKRVATFREQASALRKLAESFDMPDIKEELLNLARRCDLLAIRVAREVSDQLPRPITDLARKKEPQADWGRAEPSD